MRLREMREHTQRILTAGRDRHRMLGVEAGATAAEVRRAYIRISGRINTSSATYIQAGQRGLREEQAAAVEAFKRLADAKEALMDPESSPAKRMREEQSEAPSPWSGGDGRPARRQRGQRRRGRTSSDGSRR